MARKYNKDMPDYRKYIGELQVYDTMKQRCYSVNARSYKNYGERGIKVCDRWLGEEGFQNFYNDMGPRPKEQNGRSYQLDRIDTNGDYCPENCRWVTAKENQQNRRDNVHVILWGDRVCISEACRLLNIKRTTVLEGMRLRGKSAEEAIIHAIELSYGRRAHVS